MKFQQTTVLKEMRSWKTYLQLVGYDPDFVEVTPSEFARLLALYSIDERQGKLTEGSTSIADE